MVVLSHVGGHSEKNEMQMDKKYRNRVFTICQLLLQVVLIVSVTVIITKKQREKAEEQIFTELTTILQEQKSVQTEFSEVLQVPASPETVEDFSTQIVPETETGSYTECLTLYEMNSDFVAWISIPGTKVNYPVMYTPTEPEYYLKRDFYRSESVCGTPFVGKGTSVNDDFCIIYGHNMKNKTMFGILDKYYKKSFYQENPRIILTTVTERREYEIFAAEYSRVLYADEEGYRYYDQPGELSEEAYDKLVDYLIRNSAYDTGIVPTYGEQIILLSTCSYHTENGRFIVAARRVS